MTRRVTPRASAEEGSGIIGTRANFSVLYNHALATLALGQQYWMYRSPLVGKSVREGVKAIERARNPYAVWRYGVTPDGDNDTSITGWMLAALKMAERSGVEVDAACYEGARRWLEEVTDAATGRVGYSTSGGYSARTPANAKYEAGAGEAMTAAGMYMWLLMDGEYVELEMAEKQLGIMLKKLPEWEDGGMKMDLYYWHWGSRAFARAGGKEGRAWRKALERAASDGQASKGDWKGSWAPDGPWGHVGGRVYATAMMSLALEAEALEEG